MAGITLLRATYPCSLIFCDAPDTRHRFDNLEGLVMGLGQIVGGALVTATYYVGGDIVTTTGPAAAVRIAVEAVSKLK